MGNLQPQQTILYTKRNKRIKTYKKITHLWNKLFYKALVVKAVGIL